MSRQHGVADNVSESKSTFTQRRAPVSPQAPNIYRTITRNGQETPYSQEYQQNPTGRLFISDYQDVANMSGPHPQVKSRDRAQSSSSSSVPELSSDYFLSSPFGPKSNGSSFIFNKDGDSSIADDTTHNLSKSTFIPDYDSRETLKDIEDPNWVPTARHGCGIWPDKEERPEWAMVRRKEKEQRYNPNSARAKVLKFEQGIEGIPADSTIAFPPHPKTPTIRAIHQKRKEIAKGNPFMKPPAGQAIVFSAERDPENLLIQELVDIQKLPWHAVKQAVNAEREKQGGKGTMTISSVQGRYDRTAKKIKRTKEWPTEVVSRSLHNSPSTTYLSICHTDLYMQDEVMVSTLSALTSTIWEKVAKAVHEQTGHKVEEKDLEYRFNSLG
jgi:hypothetical protein